jgi:NhaA family Na+:H+ antiporter
MGYHHSTDTAFAIAIIAFMGNRVPVELRIFLTACAIVDDLFSILVVAVFYTESINAIFLIASVALTGILAGLNKWRIYLLLPYLLFGALLWFCLQNAGVHATLAGVILALCIPTRIFIASIAAGILGAMILWRKADIYQ